VTEAAHSSNGCVLLGSATSARDEPAPRDVIARLVWAFATSDPDQGSGVMRLLCQVTPRVPGLGPWVMRSLCQITTAAARLVRQQGTLLVSDAPPLLSAVKSLVVPSASPHGVNRPAPLHVQMDDENAVRGPTEQARQATGGRSWLSTQEKDTVPAAFFQLPWVIFRAEPSAPRSGVSAGPSPAAGAKPAVWAMPCGPVAAGAPSEA